MQLLLALLISLTSVNAQDMFAFTFSGPGCSKDANDVCLLQEQPINAELSLLEKDSNQVCHGRVTSHFQYDDQILSFKASKIKKDNCRSPAKNYFLAVLNKRISSYSTILPKTLEASIAEKMGGAVFSSAKFEKFLSETESIKSYVKGKKFHYSVEDFANVKFIARSYSDGKAKIDVLSQKLFQDSTTPPGALFAFVENEFYPISDVCVSGDEKLLKIEDKYYFYTKSQGCDTDYIFDELFQVQGNRIELVLRDGSWSL